MKIIFHLGAHKTASTHLQYNLALNRAKLRKKGITYFRFQEVEGLQRRADFLAAHINDNKEELEPCITEIKEIINVELAGYEKAIISYEGCLGYHNHLQYSDIYPYAYKILPVYVDLLKEHRVLPLYAIRDYNDYMDSTYRQELAHGIMEETINTYFANKVITPWRWTQIIEDLRTSFSEDIKVFTFEEYKLHWREICIAILNLLDVHMDLGEIKLEANKKNDSVTKNRLEFNYTLNCIFQHIPDFRYKKALYYRSRKYFFPFFDHKIGSRMLKSYTMAEVPTLIPHSDYKNEVNEIKRKYGLLKY